jgi:tRNA(Ile)-lysidine synthase
MGEAPRRLSVVGQFGVVAVSLSVLDKSSVYSRWLKEVKRQGLFHPGQRVGVAVSGGPDSVLLLHFMKELALDCGITLAVVHFNHHLRGAESEADENFVRKLAESMGIAFMCGEAEVARVAREKKRNLEATARDLRYQFFFSLVEQGRLDKVLTAHTANDQAETVLLRLLRGAGTRGLGGIQPLLEGKVARPFLDLTRAEIMHELEARKLECRLDSTNLDSRLRRNKVRLELLPWLERQFNPAIIPLLKHQADRARDEEAFLEQQAEERSRPWRVREGAEEKIPVRALRGFAPAIQRRVLRQMLHSVGEGLRGVAYAHIERLLRFATRAQSGRSLALPGGATARKEFQWLILGPPSVSTGEDAYAYPVEVPGEVAVPALGSTFGFKIVEPQGVPKAYNAMESGAMDPQKLRQRMFLRNWRAGDQFWPLGSRELRKLKELFRQRKIPRNQRKLWPVLECGDRIVWVKGFPPAASVAASPESPAILLIEEEKSSQHHNVSQIGATGRPQGPPLQSG